MLSKSNFMQFRRCSCELWLVKQRPDLVPPIDPMLQRIFDEGNVVDSWAQKLFAGAVNVDGFGVPAAEHTKQAIAGGATSLLQPTFITDSLSCRSDILVKNDDGTWDIYEVKSSTEVKEDHLFDVAFQRTCIEQAGIRIARTFLVHINSSYVRRGDVDVTQLFTTVDITNDVATILPLAQQEIARALEVLTWSKAPSALHISQCSNPAKCVFLSCYFSELQDDSLHAIATSLPKEKLIALLERGLLTPGQVPADVFAALDGVKLPGAHEEQTVSVNKEMIAAEFERLVYPLYFLDYETFFPAVPIFDGYHPYQHMVFQYSVHVVREPGAQPEHYEYLAEHLTDPAHELVSCLKRDIGDTGSVIVWNAAFEASRNDEMSKQVPEFADVLASINSRMYDLMMVVRSGHYVDSRFGGSASIKKVLPVLCPELSYTDLAINEGRTASASWATLTDPSTSPQIKAQLKKDMLAYCELDTYAMVAIYGKFLESVE